MIASMKVVEAPQRKLKRQKNVAVDLTHLELNTIDVSGGLGLQTKIIHCPSPQKSHTNIYGPLFLITAHIAHGIISIVLATSNISIQSCILCSLGSCCDDERVGPLCYAFSSPKILIGVKVWTSWPIDV